MKKAFGSVFAAILFVFASVAENIHDEYSAKVKVVWSGYVDSSKQCVVTFSDGSSATFAYWRFNDQVEKYLDDVLDDCEQRYTEIQNEMLAGGKISSAQAKANMKWWKEQLDVAIEKGYKQQIVNNTEKINDFAFMYGTDSEEYWNLINHLQLENNALRDEVNSKFGAVQTKINNDIATVQGDLNTAKSTYDQKTQNLANAQDKSDAEQKRLKAEQEKAAVEVAKCQSALNTLKNTQKAIVIADPQTVSYGSYSNDVSRISRWLGSHSKRSVFTPPVNPVTSNRYNAASANLATWMKDLGVMGYWGIELKEAYFGGTGDTGNIYNFHNDNKRGFCEMRNDDGSITNILAGFSAPTNWIDNVTITYSNGVYSAVATNAVAASSGPFSIRNGQLVDRYYNVGGKTYTASAHSVINGGVLCLRIAQSSASAVYTTYSTIAAMQSAQNDLTAYIIPLYEFNNDGSVKTDLRTSLNAVMMEY